MSNPAEFYSPLSVSGYLTPLQRQKLREKRNISICSIEEIPKIKKCTKKKIQKSKSKLPKKLQNLKKNLKSARGNLALQSLANIVCKNKIDLNDKKFFKSRSPKHLQKAKYALPLSYKGSSLRFIKHRNEKECNKPVCSNINCNLDKSDLDIKTKDAAKNDSYEDTSDMEVLNCSNSNSTAGKDANEDYEIEDLGDFSFVFPSDKILQDRRNKAIAAFNQNLTSSADSSTDFELSCADSSGSSDKQSTPKKKLYPIFTSLRNKQDPLDKGTLKKQDLKFIDASKNGEQLIIDAGQKEIGAIRCKSCHMVYTKGQEEDELLHSQYHTPYVESLRFQGWINERIVGEYDDGRIVLVKSGDKKAHLKKIEDIVSIANRDLGFSTKGLPSSQNVHYILFISNKKCVGGCLIAEEIKCGSPVILDEKNKSSSDKDSLWTLGNWYASSESVPAICGINRVWVSQEFRRQKVASRMIDCLRKVFIPGHIVDLKELAFTDPTAAGRDFAASYTGTDHFLVYR